MKGTSGMANPNNVDLFDKYATDYERVVADSLPGVGGDSRYYADRKTRLLVPYLAEAAGGELLDFGCGIGLGTESLLAKTTSETRITALDVSPESIAAARHRIRDSRVRLHTMSAGALPAGDGSFAGTFAACVFHHIPPAERDFWMRELLRVTRPGGWLAVFEHNPFNPLTRRLVARCPFDEGVALLPPSETTSRMGAVGFADIVQAHYLFFPHRLHLLVPLERLLCRLPLGGQYLTVGRRARAGALPK